MSNGVSISQFAGTPLYALAQNANINGGATLTDTEMVLFQQQCKQMGFNPEDYGLSVITQDLEGANAKETSKNVANLNKSISSSYKKQFGQKNAYEVAQQAETKAYAIIRTAKNAFESNHQNIGFTPHDLSNKPNPMDSEYANNMTAYVTDLNVWASRVADQYAKADSKTNTQLAEEIIQNTNANGQMNARVTAAVGEAVIANLSKAIEEGTATIVKEVKIQGGATRVAIKNAEGQIISAVRTAEGELMSEVRFQGLLDRMATGVNGFATREAIHEEAARTRDTVREEAADTRQQVAKNAQETQELDGFSANITRNMNASIHDDDTRARVNNMSDAILQSDLSFDEKKNLMSHLSRFSLQLYMSEAELKAEEDIINSAIARREETNTTENEKNGIGDFIHGAMSAVFPYIE
jgi:hypothetical protein